MSVQLILLTMMLPTLLLRLTDLTIIRQLQSDLRNVFAYRVTLEHFRIIEVMDGVTSHPLYEVSNSIYLNEVMATGMRMLYGSSLNVKHYAIKTTEYIVDVLTSEAYIIE